MEIDFEATPVEAARPRLATPPSWSSAARCSSTSDDPERALDVLAGLARPWLIASVPREPLWRALNLARLSYVGDLGNTPGHLNHWSKRELRAVSHPPLRGSRGAEPDPVDHGRSAAYNRRLHEAPATAPLRPLLRARPRASPRSSPSASPGASSCIRWAGRRWPTYDQVQAFSKGQAADRPVALGHQRQGLGRRPLLLGQEPRHGGAHHPALHGDRGPRRRQARPRRGQQRRPDSPSEVDSDDSVVPLENYGYDVERGLRVQRFVERLDADRLGPHAARRR